MEEKGWASLGGLLRANAQKTGLECSGWSLGPTRHCEQSAPFLWVVGTLGVWLCSGAGFLGPPDLGTSDKTQISTLFSRAQHGVQRTAAQDSRQPRF